MKIAVKIAAALALLAMLLGAVLVTKFYFVDEWAELGKGDQKAKSNCTLVTALFILGTPPSDPPSHSFQWALDRHHSFLRLLLLIRLPIVVFTDKYSAQFVADVRQSIGMENSTKIWQMSLAELPLQANASLFRSIIEEEQSANGWREEWDPELRHQPESGSLDFHILANSKSYFLKNVSDDNSFNMTRFVWLDPTYGHGQPAFFPANFEWNPKFPPGKITLLKVSPANVSLHAYQKEDLYHRDLSLVTTEFMAGDHEAIGQFHSLFEQKVLHEAENERIFDEDDQTVLVMLIKEKPLLFNLAQGQWFNAFHLF